ncbi:MAG: 1-deoxy-D-xylulose-5-phosphate synthase [Planctomycetes bacterium RIFCSPHIGHO2_02_FULL_50_42]|nr:MAG: 1-deoxy-D-xylulose-5-phosphate synthase [Planctomycetes bacterium RIFCSPHIGHO2_02_FULL_50_42]OHB92670.1 MAG: 1-deoxy-D-xylulose-5-phosphate synthase [Planctomycetes bacterium RIFCSPHIGHO2_12_FULL_51_37]OHB95711.1 MAG: 1-deoxy-D-xylulose-5-phosphate synthase [Planctomycetes bacterium RIFCSPLOWO2_02_FULL_50_16]OHC02965.1 MAG: 1-deoxy-D-xylulose-5-phosphate synthase [Planctomycetes bacterium RIFCSPLOWO2_12_FULL_50_35]
MPKLVDSINNPEDLKNMPIEDLPQLAEEIRELIIDVVSKNPGHLSSNLGVVELTMALHYCFDFKTDRLVWDVGHQCYVHKILTGRRTAFQTLRQYKGLSGFPDKKESPVYDPFTSGHSGDAISSALGLACANDILDMDRKIVAVVGDGAIGAGMSFEALNHAGGMKKNILIVLNDNEMAISPTVGAVSKYLTEIRILPLYKDLKKEIHHVLNILPIFGKPVENILEQLTEAVKRGMTPGQIFEDLGIKYYGPVDGHNIPLLINTINRLKPIKGPILFHVITKKGKGFEPASENPTQYHGAGPFKLHNGKIVKSSQAKKTSYTKVFGDALAEIAEKNKKVIAVTAAMPDGTGLTAFRDKFPDRYFDVGICEQHAVGLANGLAASGLRPVAAIYSTFLQRAFDQVFHDVCLQMRENSVVFAMDRGGLVGNDGPTHHGTFDIAYLRHLPGMKLMAPKDGRELKLMLKLAVDTEGPSCVRYPRADIPDEELDLPSQSFSWGEAEVLREGNDGAIIAYGAMVYPSFRAAEILGRDGMEVAVINARFAKPLDKELILEIVRTHPIVFTVEDHALAGGFGSAVLEMLSDEGADVKKIRRLGIPDKFIEQGSREELLRDLGLDEGGISGRFMMEIEKLGIPMPVRAARHR